MRQINTMLLQLLSFAFAGVHVTNAAAVHEKGPAPASLTNSETSFTLLYQNNLNSSDDVNHISAILLDQTPWSKAASACGLVNERLLSRAAIDSHHNDFYDQLSYLAYSGRARPGQQYIIENGVVVFNKRQSCLDFKPRAYGNPRLPVLCTQSANASQPQTSNATAQNEIVVPAGGNAYRGYRNLKSWRFSGIRYADPPERWQYSTLYSGKGQTLDATQFGSKCAQVGGGSEDCLFVNIQTPYIPKAGSKKGLKPVYFWIHGTFSSVVHYCIANNSQAEGSTMELVATLEPTVVTWLVAKTLSCSASTTA